MELQWSKTAKSILWAIVLQIIASFLMGIFIGLAAVGVAAAALSGGDVSTLAIMTGSGLGIVGLLFGIAALGAYLWYFFSISKFVTLQTNKPDANSISMVRNAVIVGLIGMICGFIPVIGTVIAAILSIAAAVMTFIGFNGFSKSAALPDVSRKGAGQLKTYAILWIVSSILAIIPLAGAILGGICTIIGIVFLIMGWNNVAKAAPAPLADGEPYI